MQKIAQVPASSGVPISKYFGGYTGTTSGLVTLFVRGSLVLAGVIVLFLVLFGGFQVIQSAGNNNPQAAAKGKQAITYAIFGFIIVVVAYLIILVIQEITGSRFVTSPFNIGGYPD